MVGSIPECCNGAVLGRMTVKWLSSQFLVVRSGVSKTATLDFWRTDFRLFRLLVERIPWKSVLKGIGVQESWTLIKKEILKAQEQATGCPLCWKMNWQGRR